MHLKSGPGIEIRTRERKSIPLTVFKTVALNHSATPGCCSGLSGGIRTPDILLPKQARYQLRYAQIKRVAKAGFEPATFGL